MPINIKISVTGVTETQAYFGRVLRDLNGPEMEKGMKRAAGIVEGAAKKNLVAYRSPAVGGVDTGVTRASVTSSVKSYSNGFIGVVGSPRISAAVMETGSKPHWPPLAALEGWAKRHGTTAYVVARAIARRGNVPRRFLSKALDSSISRIIDEINNTVRNIIQ